MTSGFAIIKLLPYMFHQPECEAKYTWCEPKAEGGFSPMRLDCTCGLANVLELINSILTPTDKENTAIVDGSAEDTQRYEKLINMTPLQQEEQRRSFAYGNAKIENDLITREMINEQAELMATEVVT